MAASGIATQNLSQATSDIAQQQFGLLISQISTQLINSTSAETQQHIEQALAALASGGRKDRCYVFLFDEQLTTMSNTHEWTAPGITSFKAELQNIDIAAMPWFFEQMRNQGQVVVDDVKQLPPAAIGFQQELTREGIQAMMAVGMYLEHRLMGFVGCDLVQRQHHWSAEDIQQMQLVADMISNTIARHRTETRLRQVEAELRLANEQLLALAHQDSLTQVANRRALDKSLKDELQRASRMGRELTLFMVDIDHFKQLNDTYGHRLGDSVLADVAEILATQFRRSGELVARFGGDEFVVISPLVDAATAQTLAAAVLYRVRALSYPEGAQITVSIGVYQCIPQAPVGADNLLQEVDAAVYQAKLTGRNQVVFVAN
ncbi:MULTISPECIES: GGDEF domain-containing protein [Idiomarina]|uniref:GGDEF domain-containing protein n=1 Tax=Idiomarina TaxID=135575 RepID=UPI00129AF550|nr:MULTISPECIES: diguanylate cyclase [Idiomarina]MRJ41089.1 diguanylate cyclase [Idiomarina sp. FeN1]NCU56254.1 diguanylate cyclase [Idiomarina sp. FenA--70]NCU59273.1 diguanylate cyclase [Idiomarina sp. FenBw--71]UUN12452.1 diguanylate cyclase [Idiomarina loihiensis]